MNVLSLFDGISAGRVALERAGIQVDNYFAAETDKYAIKVTMANYPNTVQLGDVTKWREWDIDWSSIDLLIGGSPCQDFSIARTAMKHERNGLKGDKSSLFYVYLDILNYIRAVNPSVKFMLENVKMKRESESQLNDYLGVEGKHICSSLVSFQTRARIYWANWSFTQPDKRHVSFQDYKDTDPDYCKKFKMNRTPSRERMWNDGLGRTVLSACSNVTNSDKVGCLTLKQDRCPNSGLVECDDFGRYLTTREQELAQTLPTGYVESHITSYHKACQLLGNSWTVDVIAHIFNSLQAAH